MHNRTVRRAAAAVPPALLFCAHLTPAVSAASAPETAEAAAPSAIDRLAHLLVQGEPLLWMLPLALLIASGRKTVPPSGGTVFYVSR